MITFDDLFLNQDINSLVVPLAVVAVCTDLFLGKEPHRQVGMGELGSLGGINC